MFDKEVWTELLRSLRAQKVRALLTSFGVCWGMVLLILLLGIGNGLQEGIRKSVGAFANNSLFIWEGPRALPFGGQSPGKPIRLTLDDIEALKASLPEIQEYSPRTRLEGASVVRSAGQSGSFTTYGVTPALWHIQNFSLRSGRFIDVLDYNERRRTAVIGSRVADILFPHQSPLARLIQIQGFSFQVVGALASVSEDDSSDETATAIFIPYSTLSETYMLTTPIGVTGMKIAEGTDIRRLSGNITAILSARKAFDPHDTSALYFYDHQQRVLKVRQLFLAESVFIWLVGLGTLFSGIVGVGNIMLVTVRERTKEFGIRAALGATPASIVSAVVREAVLLTSAAGGLGIVIGLVLLRMIRSLDFNSEYYSTPTVTSGVICVAFFLLIVSGVLAGLIPAIKASKISPHEALGYVG